MFGVVPLVTAAVFAPILRWADHREDRRDQATDAPSRASCARRGEIILPAPVGMARARAAQVLVGIAGPPTPAAADGLLACTGPSIWSFGERVRIWTRPVAPDETRVTVESRPRLGWTEFDFGRNRRNVKRIISALDADPTRDSR
jgi:hypothetical protein